MYVNLSQHDQNIWSRFVEVSRSWDRNYAEFRFYEPAQIELTRLEHVLGPDREWKVKTGLHWEVEFSGFSTAFRNKHGLEQIRIDIGEMHMSGIAEWTHNDDLQLELSIWPPDLFGIDDDEFRRIVVGPSIPSMPAVFVIVLQLVRDIQQACGFQRVELAMEGDSGSLR